MTSLPEILETRTLLEGRVFLVEEVQLRFSNGQERTYERLRARGFGAVMVVPVEYPHRLYLVREYAVGVEQYVIGFPKGLIEKDETLFDAANRELMEEAGFGAEKIEPLMAFSFVPSYMNYQMHAVIGTGLYAASKIGDEPEPLELIEWDLNNLDALLAHPDFTEARSIAALLLLKEKIRQGYFNET